MQFGEVKKPHSINPDLSRLRHPLHKKGKKENVFGLNSYGVQEQRVLRFTPSFARGYSHFPPTEEFYTNKMVVSTTECNF